jgi:hypothetical protein
MKCQFDHTVLDRVIMQSTIGILLAERICMSESWWATLLKRFIITEYVI